MNYNMTMLHKRLYRSRNAILGGGLAGFAEYFEHDPRVWRFGFIVFLLLTGFMPGVLIYAFGWILIPKEPTPSGDVAREHV